MDHSNKYLHVHTSFPPLIFERDKLDLRGLFDRLDCERQFIHASRCRHCYNNPGVVSWFILAWVSEQIFFTPVFLPLLDASNDHSEGIRRAGSPRVIIGLQQFKCHYCICIVLYTSEYRVYYDRIWKSGSGDRIW